LSSAHSDVSDHRFEQRGLLHARLLVEGVEVHVVVVHFGLIHAGRERQVKRLGEYIARELPPAAPLIVAGDFNDWGAKLLRPMADLDLKTFDSLRLPTYPARLPLLHMDRIYVRGLRPLTAHVPHGRIWTRMSDHLPLIAELEL
jgi:endonuclease/exonuclease/phosphatase family metal-dependent hydrolase